MSTMPLVSVITPTLNQARYISETLESVQDQLYGEVEHIVVDGGSSDGTIEILRTHEGTPRFRWTTGPDAGMYDAVNKGLRVARGEILAYLNSDDLYLPWTIQTAVGYLQAHPEVDLVYGDYMALHEATSQRVLLLQPPYSRDYVRRTGFIPQPTVFWRRSLYDRLGEFDDTLQYVGDCDYWMRAGDTAKIAKIDEILAVDRLQSDAKRSTASAPLVAELALVRHKHRRVGDRGRSWLDRAYAAFWRRIQLVRLLTLVAKPRRPSERWAGLLSGYVVRPHFLPMILSLVPLVGVRHLGAAVELQPLRAQRGSSADASGSSPAGTGDLS
jgi:glycosyltransferase involved in cell wall biosynthesis